MKYLLSFILFFAPISSQPADHLQLSDLDELRWKNRIILIFSNDFDTYKKQLEASSDEIADRDIIWFIVSDSGMVTNYKGSFAEDLSAKINKEHSNSDTKVILIGKDGGIKARASNLYLSDLFQQIDAMPMRIYEIKQKNGN
jgi:F0F1-type ATP synthase gamma subunit